jgi:hypothetical protein
MALMGLNQYGYAEGVVEPTSAGDLSFAYASYPLAGVYKVQDRLFVQEVSYENLGFNAPGSLTLVGSMKSPQDAVIMLGPGQDFGHSQRIIEGSVNLHVTVKPKIAYNEDSQENFVGMALEGTIGGTPVKVVLNRFADENYIDPGTLKMVHLNSLLYALVMFQSDLRTAYLFQIP